MTGANLDDGLGSLWSALSERGAAYAGEIEPPLPCPGLACLAIIEDAPRSQFDAMLHALDKGRGLPPGSAAIAAAGRGFHGRRGRAWAAKRGNVHLSVYYPLAMEARHAGAGLTALPAVAVVDAVRNVYGDAVTPAIKWVNDILVEEKKVAGVLTNTRVRGTAIEHAVFGIGVNVAVSPEIVPSVFVPACTCLNAASGIHAAPGRVLWPLLGALDRRFREFVSQGPGPIIDAYRRHAGIVGREVQVFEETAGEHGDARGSLLAAGIVDGIEEDLSLRIRGCPGPITRGRLAIIEPNPGGP